MAVRIHHDAVECARMTAGAVRETWRRCLSWVGVLSRAGANGPGKELSTEKKKKQKNMFRYGELNPGLAGLMLCMRAADASHYTITDLINPVCSYDYELLPRRQRRKWDVVLRVTR